jgi:hypothetical protein
MGKVQKAKGIYHKCATRLAIFSMSLLISFTAVYFYSPVIKSHAEESQTLDFNVNVDPELSLTTSSEDVNMEARINSFTHSSIDLTVKTNSLYGFTLSIEDADNNTNMVHENPNVSEVFTSSFEGQKTSATLDNGTWGYSLDGGENYISMPVYGSPRLIDQKVKRQTSLVTNTVDFGAKVGNATSGTYSDTVLFTAYTNGADGLPEDGTEVEGAKSTVKRMQGDFVCDELEIGERAYVIDIRDKNKYSVMRLKDGNCWMLNDLRLVDKTISSADSDLPLGSTFVVKPSDIKSLSLVNHVYAQLAELGIDVDEENFDPTILADEEIMPHLDINVSGVYKDQDSTFYTLYTASAGSSSEMPITIQDIINGSSSGSDDNGSTYTEFSEISSSICPAGWKLPSYVKLEYMLSLYNDNSSSIPVSGLQITTSPFAENATAGYRTYSERESASSGEERMTGYGMYWLSSYAGEGRNVITPIVEIIPLSEFSSSMSGYGVGVFGPTAMETLEMGIGTTIRCMTGTSEVPESFTVPPLEGD